MAEWIWDQCHQRLSLLALLTFVLNNMSGRLISVT